MRTQSTAADRRPIPPRFITESKGLFPYPTPMKLPTRGRKVASPRQGTRPFSSPQERQPAEESSWCTAGIRPTPEDQALHERDLRLQASAPCYLDKEPTIFNNINLITLYPPKGITVLHSTHATMGGFRYSIFVMSKQASKWFNNLTGR